MATAKIRHRTASESLLKVSYVFGNDLISQNRAGVKSIYHVDGLGSTRALTDASGVVTDIYIYDAFGRTIGQVGSTGNVYLFAGEQRDFATGLDYLRARWMDTGSGRFVSRDPFEGFTFSPLTLHKYLYAFDNPVIYFDPSGLITVNETVEASSIQKILTSQAKGVISKKGLRKTGCVILEFVVGEVIDQAGIYVFEDAFGLYTGKSKNVERRLKQHGKRVAKDADGALRLIAQIKVTAVGNALPEEALKSAEQRVLNAVREAIEVPQNTLRGKNAKPGTFISNKIQASRKPLLPICK